MKPVVVRNIPRADTTACGILEGLGVSTSHEALGRSGLMKPYMRPIWPGASICGPAVTILAQPGDNWMIHVAIEQCKPGDVLVVGVTADNTDGMFGDLLATSLKARSVLANWSSGGRVSSRRTPSCSNRITGRRVAGGV